MTFTIRFAESDDVEQVGQLFDSYRQFYEQEANIELSTSYIRERLERHESVILLSKATSRENSIGRN